MRVFLTGDVHNWIKSSDQLFLKRKSICVNEIFLMKKWCNIVAKHNIKATLFITGKFAKDNFSELKEIFLQHKNNIEIGGHTYSAFSPDCLFFPMKILTGKRYGPKWYQKWDIKKTLEILKNVVGTKIVSWRTHEYNSSPETFSILENKGVKVVTEKHIKECYFPIKIGKILSQPINIKPDHENIIHQYENDNKKKISVGKWFDEIKEVLEKNNNRECNIVILVHPSCMEIVDEFKTFEKLCELLSQYSVYMIKDINE